MSIRIVDSSPGLGRESQDWDAPSPRLTLREILADRIRREVERFNRNRTDLYQGLVAPEESERVLNGYRVKRVRELDPDREIDRGLRAFEQNGFLVFANGRQIQALDEEIDLAATTELEFLKLIPLVGG
jgi:hypothetical protein